MTLPATPGCWAAMGAARFPSPEQQSVTVPNNQAPFVEAQLTKLPLGYLSHSTLLAHGVMRKARLLVALQTRAKAKHLATIPTSRQPQTRSTSSGRGTQYRAASATLGRVTRDINLPRPSVPIRDDGPDPSVVDPVPLLDRRTDILLEHGAKGPVEDVLGRRREGGGDLFGVWRELADVAASPGFDCVYMYNKGWLA